MRYSKVVIDAFGYELGPDVVSTAELENRIKPVYDRLRIPVGQLEALTGIHERRWWPENFRLSDGAHAAAVKALEAANIPASQLGAVVYTGVCREQFEPATACRVADLLGVPRTAAVYDISNACLGVLNGILDVANRIELGQIRAGLVVSCESAREINEIMIDRMLAEPTMELFAKSLATLTGGSGAIAVLLTDGSFGNQSRRLLGGMMRTAPEFHNLCLWGVYPEGDTLQQSMQTDSIAVMQNGVALGIETWQAFLGEMGWSIPDLSRVICHQVGSAHQKEILKSLGIPADLDYTTYGFLGNIGTVALPITAAIADERGIFSSGDKVGFLGIGSGLNCLMLGLQW